MNTYYLKHTSKCPNGNLVDTYDIEVRSSHTIQVENLIDTMRSAPNPVYQEDLADFLRSKLGVHVRVSGWHYGVFVVSDRP